jgi:hypothetical protein
MMENYANFANVITAIAAVLISILTERIPLVRVWWRDGLDANYTPEAADTIRLGVQAGLTLLAALLAYYAADLGYLPGPAPSDNIFIPALLSALMGVFVNQGAYHLDKKYWRGRDR